MGGTEDFAGVVVGEAGHCFFVGEPFVAGVFVGEDDLFGAGSTEEVGDGFVDAAFFGGIKDVVHVALKRGDAVHLSDAGLFAEFSHSGLPCGFAFFKMAFSVVPVLAVVEEEVERFASLLWVAGEDEAGGEFLFDFGFGARGGGLFLPGVFLGLAALAALLGWGVGAGGVGGGGNSCSSGGLVTVGLLQRCVALRRRYTVGVCGVGR